MKSYGDAIVRTAHILGSNLRLGRGKKEAITLLLVESLGNPCPYCQKPLTLENASIDHIEPYADSKLRDKIGTGIKEHFDRIENLHICCHPCNLQKEDFSHQQFVLLLAFMQQHPSVGALLSKRLSRSRRMWK